MSTIQTLRAEIDCFLAETGMKKTVFGRAALNDGAFVKRLQDGGGVTLATADRVRAFIKAERDKQRHRSPSVRRQVA